MSWMLWCGDGRGRACACDGVGALQQAFALCLLRVVQEVAACIPHGFLRPQGFSKSSNKKWSSGCFEMLIAYSALRAWLIVTLPMFKLSIVSWTSTYMTACSCLL